VAPPVRKRYVPVKGDPVDEMMAMYINQCPFFVPIERLSEGNYFLGAKKIFAKIMNNKLIIRVGGGFCVIDEFMKQLE
jgi:Growth-Arrest-Specific Protein 2 Domain